MTERQRQAVEATAHALGSLPVGWAVIDDAGWPDRALATIDHVVVGPQGIFVIDSKDWPGSITVEGGTLRRDGTALTSSVVGAATAATAMARLVPAEHRDHVRAVICVGGSEGPIALVGGVLVCSSTTLVTLLTTRPEVLSATAVPDVAGSLRSHVRALEGPTRTGFLDALLGVVRRRRPR